MHKELKRRLKQKYSKIQGKLTIIEFLPHVYTIGELEADLRRHCLGKRPPTVLCIDYIDVISYKEAGRRSMSEWSEQLHVCTMIRAMTYKNNLCTWVAGTLSTGSSEEQVIATRKNKGGAKNRVFDFDLLFTVNQSPEDELANRITIFQDKTRKQEGGWLYTIRPDFSRSRFCVKSLNVIKKAAVDAQIRKQEKLK